MTRVARCLAAILVLGATTAASGATAFRNARPIMPGGVGGNRLVVDVPLLAGARPLRYDVAGRYAGGLDDLRLFGTDGEVPYLVVPPPQPERRWETGRVAPVLPTEEESGFEVDLGHVAQVDRLRLAGLAAPLLKRMRLEGSGDRLRWVVLVEETTVFDLPGEGLRRTEIEFPSAWVRHLRVTWDDRASARAGVPAGVSVGLATVPAPPSVFVPLGFERRASEPGTSRFRIRLPGPGLPIRAIELDCGSDRLLRPARVTEAELTGDAVRPRTLGNAVLRRVTRDQVVASDLRIPITPPKEVTIELEVDDEDNPPLDVRIVRAELPALPTLYFESPDRAGLTATFGAPDLAAPRYDLEAARGTIDLAAAAEATWGETTALAAPPSVTEDGTSEDVAGVGARIDLRLFQWVRPLEPGPSGLTALRLDAAVLAHSAGLADVRLVDPTGRQIPYVVEHVAEPLVVTLPLPAIEPAGEAAGERTTTHRLTLPYPHLPDARLVLETTGRVFERQVVVRAEVPRRDPRTGERMHLVRAATWRHVDPERPAPALTIALPPLEGRTLLVDVGDGDNSPLPLASARLLLPTRRLRFVRATGAEPVLAYGATGMATPRYDLTLLAPRILGASAHEIDPSPEAATATGADEGQSDVVGRRVFWGVLAATVLVLLVVLTRLVRVEERPDAV